MVDLKTQQHFPTAYEAYNKSSQANSCVKRDDKVEYQFVSFVSLYMIKALFFRTIRSIRAIKQLFFTRAQVVFLCNQLQAVRCIIALEHQPLHPCKTSKNLFAIILNAILKKEIVLQRGYKWRAWHLLMGHHDNIHSNTSLFSSCSITPQHQDM